MNLSELLLNLPELLLNLPEIETNVDIVFVIDAAKTMKPIIDKLQQVASVYDKLLEACRSKNINCIRFKVIWYRDFFVDGDKTYGESRFFEMPREEENFKEYLGGINAYGGNNTRRPGLAALSMALESDFVQEGDKKFHIIIQFTDTSSYSFEEIHELSKKCHINNSILAKRLNNDIPKSYERFWDCWENNVVYPLGTKMADMLIYNRYAKLDKVGKRLILFTPEVYPWSDMEIELTYTIRVPLNNAVEFNLESLYDVFSHFRFKN